MKKETSNFQTARVDVEPRWLMCIACLRGGGQCSRITRWGIAQLWERIQENPDLHLIMRTSFDEVGARTALFDSQTPAERRQDLDVLQRLGLCPTDTRTARDLLTRVSELIPDLYGICRYPDNIYGKWEECELADGTYYSKGNHPLAWAQLPCQMAEQKAISCAALADTDRVVIRAHHLLCIVCYLARHPQLEPLAEDNLCEALIKFRENPDIPVTLVEGPQDCCICPPCHAYNQERGLCVALCHLRDRKKDLDTFVALGMSPGDTLPARELYRRVYERIPNVMGICRYETQTSPEWKSCNGPYEQGLSRGIFPEFERK